MNLYRGQSAYHWQQELELKGWPRDLAKQAASFLVGDIGAQMPSWHDLKKAMAVEKASN